MTVRHFLLAVLVLLLSAGSVNAQRVERTGRGLLDRDQELDRLLAGAYTLIAQDTLIANGDTLDGPVLVAGATMRVNGTVDGDLYIVDSNVFLRPTAEVTGQVVNLGGGFFPSEQARIAAIVDEPLAPYEVERPAPDVLRIVGTRQRSALVLDGVRGVRIPTYDRVDGLTVGIGAGYLTPALGRVEPMVRGWVEYRTEPGEFTGGGELSATRGRSTLAVGAERTTASEDRWIRNDLLNSIAVLWDGDDYRNYYAADRGWLEARRVLERGPREINAFLRLQVEDATSRAAGDPWILFDPDSLRPNPAVDEMRITSVRAGGTVGLRMPRIEADLGVETEFGFEGLDGERTFQRFELFGEGAVPALADHTLELEWHLRGPLPGTDSLPRQRWSFVGGSGTLYTYEIAEFAGDRVVFAGLRYIIPIPDRWGVSFFGQPTLNLRHIAATAWTAEARRAVRHNLGLELRWPFFYGRVFVDPENLDDPKFSFNVTLPRRTRPWMR